MQIEGHAFIPDGSSAGNRVNKAFEKISSKLFVKENGEACFDGITFATTHGPCISNIIGKVS